MHDSDAPQDPATMEPGAVVIESVIMAMAINEITIRPDGFMFHWAANAPEQIEAALAQLGWEVRRIRN